MKHARLIRFLQLGTVVLGLAAARGSFAQLNDGEEPKEMAGVRVDEKNGSKVPLDLVFRDDQGREVKLADYFNRGRPVLLTLNYFGCPSLCGLQLNGLLELLKQQKYLPGKEFELLTVSFEPLDTVEIASAKKQNYIREYGRAEAAKGWHFLTGKVDAIKTLTNALGFYYVWNEAQQQWIHRAVLIVCTPDGRISRYLGDISFDPETMRLSVVEASGGKIGSVWDKIFLSCFHYIRAEGRYVPIAQNLMAVAGAVTVVVLGVLILGLRSAEKRRRRLFLSATGGAGAVPAGPPGSAASLSAPGDKGF